MHGEPLVAQDLLKSLPNHCAPGLPAPRGAGSQSGDTLGLPMQSDSAQASLDRHDIKRRRLSSASLAGIDPIGMQPQKTIAERSMDATQRGNMGIGLGQGTGADKTPTAAAARELSGQLMRSLADVRACLCRYGMYPLMACRSTLALRISFAG